jgi:hypothetical protein
LTAFVHALKIAGWSVLGLGGALVLFTFLALCLPWIMEDKH